MDAVTILLDPAVVLFYTRIAKQAGLSLEQVLSDALFKLAGELRLEALKEAGALPTALDTPAPFAAVKNYGDSAIEYVLQIWCKSEDYWTTLFDGNKNVKEVFDARGITMTYPHINVHLDK